GIAFVEVDQDAVAAEAGGDRAGGAGPADQEPCGGHAASPPPEVDAEPVGESNECVCSHRWNEPVPTEVEGVSQPGGRPISDSTKRGFRSTLGDPLSPSVGVVTARGPCTEATVASPGDFLSCCDGGPPRSFGSCAVGVGQEPEPLPLVRGANGGRGEQTPFRIEPEDGQRPENVSQRGGSNRVASVRTIQRSPTSRA